MLFLTAQKANRESKDSDMEDCGTKLVLICIFAGVLHGAALTVDSDVTALKQLKESVDPGSIPAASCLSTWDFRFDPCQSAFGVHFTCGLRCSDGDPKRVTEITLEGAGYNGSLPESVGKLSSLQILDLSNNAFRGPIPPSIGNITALERLVLTRNSFSGNIPASVGFMYSLQQFSLDNNFLEGSIPGLNGLQSLVRLELQGNKFSGDFPNLSGMKSLNYLDASNNQLFGSLGLPPNLVELGLRNNRFSGPLALNLEELGLIQVVDLSHNEFSGDLQSGFFNHPSLEQLTLSNNRFTSIQVPGNYGTNSGLIAVDLSYNQLQGPLPPFMATIPRLSSLSLQYNYFTGIIPFQYAMKASSVSPGKEPLVRLFLAGNYLFGLIPAPFMSLSPDNVNMSFVDNCLLECPASLFFCQGGQQKTESTCRSFTQSTP